MKIKIAESIRTLRKQHSFTQEQLAQALGVTTSAVYKWESGQSVPEVKMLVELADLFEISVDSLLGYDRQNEKVEHRIVRIQQFVVEREFEEAMLEAEKTLKKYPNKFEVVYVSASVYMVAYYEKKEPKHMQRAIELFYNAIDLLYQNEESSINETTIVNIIGNMYISAGQEDKGLELLKKHNTGGMNSSVIGLTLARSGKVQEAKEYLYQSYSKNLNNTFCTMSGMMYMYGEEGNEMYQEIGLWLLGYMDSLVSEQGTITFIAKLKALVLTQMAVYAANFGNFEQAEQYITNAYQLATAFDKNPDYSVQAVKFLQELDGAAIVTDGMGEKAVFAMEKYILSEAKPGEGIDFIKKKLKDLKIIEEAKE